MPLTLSKLLVLTSWIISMSVALTAVFALVSWIQELTLSFILTIWEWQNYKRLSKIQPTEDEKGKQYLYWSNL